MTPSAFMPRSRDRQRHPAALIGTVEAAPGKPAVIASPPGAAVAIAAPGRREVALDDVPGARYVWICCEGSCPAPGVPMTGRCRCCRPHSAPWPGTLIGIPAPPDRRP